MPGRTTTNKRQREQQRKERQAEKISKRDERRTRRKTDGDVPEATELGPANDVQVENAPAAMVPPSSAE